jgi:hypothetical protein
MIKVGLRRLPCNVCSNLIVEEDVFGSDFESTDEEAEKEAEVRGETEAVSEERSTKKVSLTSSTFSMGSSS